VVHVLKLARTLQLVWVSGAARVGHLCSKPYWTRELSEVVYANTVSVLTRDTRQQQASATSLSATLRQATAGLLWLPLRPGIHGEVQRLHQATHSHRDDHHSDAGAGAAPVRNVLARFFDG
jgi:hypothetical protein